MTSAEWITLVPIEGLSHHIEVRVELVQLTELHAYARAAGVGVVLRFGLADGRAVDPQAPYGGYRLADDDLRRLRARALATNGH